MNSQLQSTSKLLIIDDEDQLRRLIGAALLPHGYEIIEAKTAHEGLSYCKENKVDAVILDLGLPDRDGLEALEELRELHIGPILVLSVRDDEESIVTALNSGAHDYMRKPFLVGELVARLQLAIRHHIQAMKAPLYKVGPLSIDIPNRKVFLKDREIKLTVTEFSLLKALVQRKGQVVRHNEILQEVWGPKSTEHIQYLRVYIGHLRQKLEDSELLPRIIVTEPGVGYRLIDPDSN